MAADNNGVEFNFVLELINQKSPMTIFATLDPILDAKLSAKFYSSLGFDQSQKFRDLLKLCDWSKCIVESNFMLKFLYRIEFRLGDFS